MLSQVVGIEQHILDEIMAMIVQVVETGEPVPYKRYEIDGGGTIVIRYNDRSYTIFPIEGFGFPD